MTRARALVGTLGGFLLSGLFAHGAAAQAAAGGATLTGKVTSEFGAPLEFAQVYITEMKLSVGVNNQGVFTMNIPQARINGQQVVLRARSFGYLPAEKPITIKAGTTSDLNFALRQDVNRLSEVVVTGSIEQTAKANVPFAIARMDTADIPIPASDPMTALEGKVPGLRIAAPNGQPGTAPDILMRGPTSINSQGRSQAPLIIVDGAIQENTDFSDLGGLDIESIEVVKGAAGASLYGTRAANGVIQIRTKRGANQDGVKVNVRTEYGYTDLNSLHYNNPIYSPLQLDETGARFCVQGSGNQASCSKTIDWMTEMFRINSVKADTTRTQQNVQWSGPSSGDGSLLNVYQASPWPGTRYIPFAQMATTNPVTLNSVDATGRLGTIRYFASGSYGDTKGSIKGLNGQQNVRGRLNLDYDIRQNWTVSASTFFDRGTTDLRGFGFGSVLRGARAGTNYLAQDSLGRYLLRSGGTGFEPTGNGGTNPLYNSLSGDQSDSQNSNRYLGNISTTFYPVDWLTLEGVFAYDTRGSLETFYDKKGYRTQSVSLSTNLGRQQNTSFSEESYNGSLTATVHHSITSDLDGKVSVRGLMDRDDQWQTQAFGDQYLVRDVFTLNNTSQDFSNGSASQSIRDLGYFVGGNLTYKDRYVLDATYRRDGSSLFGAGNRWAPFGRISGVWRLSDEPWYNFKPISEIRFRGSYGTAGSTPNFVAQYETYNVTTSGITLGQAGNPDLKPETTHETELGSDFTLFQRLGVEFTKADSRTSNQILNVPTPNALGFSTQWRNAGTLANHTYEIGLNLPVITTRDFNWSMKGSWDRTRTLITQLFAPAYYYGAGVAQGADNFFYATDSAVSVDGHQKNAYGNIYGVHFYTSCADMAAQFASQKTATYTPPDPSAYCGPGKDFQVNDQGWVVWVGGNGHTYKDGITSNLWQTKLPAGAFLSDGKTLNPWNTPLYFGMPIFDRHLRGQTGEGAYILHILGSALPNFRLTYGNNVQYKRLTAYALFDGSFGNSLYNQGQGWGLLDLNSGYFDAGGKSVQTAKPEGYEWRGVPGGGVGGFYDFLGPNNYAVEDASYVKLREVDLTYHVGPILNGGDWSIGVIGRNLHTWTKYTGFDPEVGFASQTGLGSQNSSQANSALINAIDAGGGNFPTLRTVSFSLSTRF